MKIWQGILLILLCVIGCKLIVLQGYERCDGKIIGSYSRYMIGKGHSEKVIMPIAAFTYQGVLYKTKIKNEIKFYPAYEEGATCSVLFYPDNPQDAEVFSVSTFWFSTQVIALTGILIFVWLGIANYRAIAKQSTTSV